MTAIISQRQRDDIVRARHELLKPAPAGANTLIAFGMIIANSSLPSPLKSALIKTIKDSPLEKEIVTEKILLVVTAYPGFSSFTFPELPSLDPKPTEAVAAREAAKAPAKAANNPAAPSEAPQGAAAGGGGAAVANLLRDPFGPLRGATPTLQHLPPNFSFENVMNFTTDDSHAVIDTLIAFTDREKKFLLSLISQRPMHQLTLLNLFTCHMHHRLTTLKSHAPATWHAAIETSQDELNKAFLSIQLEEMSSKKLFDTFTLPATGKNSLGEAYKILGGIKVLLTLSTARITSKPAIDIIEQIQEELEMGRMLLTNRHIYMLINGHIAALRKSLPQVCAVPLHSVENTVDNLIDLVHWFQHSVTTAVKAKQIRDPLFTKNFPQLLEALIRVKNQIGSDPDTLIECTKKCQGIFIAERSEQIRLMQMSYSKLKFSMALNGKVEKGVLQPIIYEQQLSFFWHNIINVIVKTLESGVLMLRFAQRFHRSTEACHYRFSWNLHTFILKGSALINGDLVEKSTAREVQELPTYLNDLQRAAIISCATQLRDNIKRHILNVTFPDRGLPLHKFFTTQPLESERAIIPDLSYLALNEQLIQMVRDTNIIRFNLDDLKKLLAEQLTIISQCIQEAGFEFGRHDRVKLDALIHYLQLSCMPDWTILCVLDLMVKDVESAIAGHCDSATMPPMGSSPFSKELTDCLLLEGIERLLHTHLPRIERPMRGFAAKTAPPERAKKARKRRAPAAAAAVPSTARRARSSAPKSSAITVIPPSATRPDWRQDRPTFDPKSIRRADNLRKILDVIGRETGLRLTFDHGSRHATLETADGKAVAPVPYHGGGSTTASPGVIADIRRSVAAAAAAAPR